MQEARLNEAYRSFDRATKLQPGLAEAWKRHGVVLGIMGCYREAAGSLREAIRIEPKDQEAWMLRGFCLVRLFQYAEARACFERAMVLSGDAYAQYWRDMLLEEMSQEEEFRRARRLGLEWTEGVRG